MYLLKTQPVIGDRSIQKSDSRSMNFQKIYCLATYINYLCGLRAAGYKLPPSELRRLQTIYWVSCMPAISIAFCCVCSIVVHELQLPWNRQQKQNCYQLPGLQYYEPTGGTMFLTFVKCSLLFGLCFS